MKDVKTLTFAQLKKRVGRVDLIVASPECTSHTCAKGSAPRVGEQPTHSFPSCPIRQRLQTQVAGNRKRCPHAELESYESWLAKIRGFGYNVKEQVINASDHGVPQARRRLFRTLRPCCAAFKKSAPQRRESGPPHPS